MKSNALGACACLLFLVACSDKADAPADGASTAPAAENTRAAADTATPADTAVAADAHEELPKDPNSVVCSVAGPQTPRDIANPAGLNPVMFAFAPDPSALNLCNIHLHTNAEHKGPGFSVHVSDDVHGGYACNDRDSLTEAQLVDPTNGNSAFKGVKPGDSIEVHWVYSACDVAPGPGLGSCLTEGCSDPQLRVESQVFLVVNDPTATNFGDYVYAGAPEQGPHQPKGLPTGSGDPVVFRGSTTGPSYNQSTCSSLDVTWSVRPQCARVDVSSLHAWSEAGNVFNETSSHGVRQLVTEEALLAPIE